MQKISRRSFLKTSAAAAGGAVLLRSARSANALAGNAVTPRLSQFGYADVQLLDGPMLEQFRANHAFFLSLDDDRLLKPFRQKAGLPAPGEDMGGWYSFSAEFDPPRNMTGYIAGHSFGQYLSGLARASAVTGSKPTQQKVQRLVRGFAATVSKKFYMDYPLPAYTFDKTNCGLIDAHQFAADPEALAVLNHATDAVLPFLPEKALTRAEQEARPHKNIAFTWDETYTLPENFYLAWQRGAGPRYRHLAERFLQDKDYFDPLAEGENVLPGQHAYSHLNALCSAFQCYLVSGSDAHLRAARNGFDFVRTTQSFATGGWGPDETFRAPGSGEIGESLEKTHASFETPCGAYGHFKIARYLLSVSGDSRYGDSMERVLYNTILGAKPLLEDGSSFYYSDYNDSASKFYHQDKWPCCSGTFPQITADYGISSYFRSARGVYVNLYVPSKVTWRQNGTLCSLTQRTNYPLLAQSSLDLQLDQPEEFEIALRIPAWAGSGTQVSINGRKVDQDISPGAFFLVRRTWKSRDRVEIEFDMPMRLEAVDPQHPNTLALTHGPLALFAIGESFGQFDRSQLMHAAQTSSGSSDWQVESSTGKVRFTSFASIRSEKYRLYQKVL
ncbi:beta-L-arabinofuranosidase domain-containing protein [Paracidobacterium acidisoli]|uniref:Twin-arginine translocation signal domain-containing protein n=1 Tax=Paracidobacterium acidisoli TaxID=2303751 RepID=A0A372ILF1_9BACT|nr:beta-L-arabinofuranosidase domain-containing protein [Paracidobacterium acidisoli]MBT9332370.1 glycoside hydrolase family 127 protein [Paracidobacterium acidisoli]